MCGLTDHRCVPAIPTVTLEALPAYEDFSVSFHGRSKLQSNLTPQIASSLMSFYKTDYRIRPFIASRLNLASMSNPDQVYRRQWPKQAALQLALCYCIGFGVTRDEVEANNILQKHHIEPVQLERLLTQIRNIQQHTIDYGTEGLYASLQSQGYEYSFGGEGVLSPQYYRERALLEEFGKTLVREITDLTAMLGEEHPLTLYLIQTRAGLLKDQGHTSDAEALELRVREQRTRSLGIQHPETLDIIRSLAFTYRDQHRWERAAGLDEQLLAEDLRLYGAEHPITLTQMGNLALSLQHMGCLERAEELFEAVLEVDTKALGDEHPTTLTIKANIAGVYGKQQRFSEAETLFTAVIAADERILGQGHPETLLCKGNLANLLFDDGRFAEAEKLEAELVEISSRALGEDHPDTLNMIANLARTIQDQGRLEQAEALQSDQLKHCKAALGETHPLTLDSMDNLAINYLEQDRYAEAEALLLRTVAARKKLQGNQQSTITSLGQLGASLSKQGRWADLQKVRAEELEMCEVVLGPGDPDTVLTRWGLSTAYAYECFQAEEEGSEYLQKLQEAERLTRLVMDAWSETLGERHKNTVASMDRLKLIFRFQRRWLDAGRLTYRCYEAQVQGLGHYHPTILQLIFDMILTSKMISVFGPVTREPWSE